MSYVELDIKDIKRMLSVFSVHFGDKPMTEGDVILKQKLEVMLKAEIEWNKDE
jgi:hypothetical protein